MTLDEAIIHCEEVAENKEQAVYDLIAFGYSTKEERDECIKCADEHRQLANWLKDYKRLLEKEDTFSNIKCSTCKHNETSEKCDKCYLYSEWRKVNEID